MRKKGKQLIKFLLNRKIDHSVFNRKLFFIFCFKTDASTALKSMADDDTYRFLRKKDKNPMTIKIFLMI